MTTTKTTETREEKKNRILARLRGPKKSPFETDHERKIYFWRMNTDPGHIQFSSHYHPLLPFHCEIHDWYTDKPCPNH